MINHAKQSANVLTKPQHYMVESLGVTRLQSSNDSHQRIFHQEQPGRKLLTIGVMLLVMAFLVWSMG